LDPTLKSTVWSLLADSVLVEQLVLKMWPQAYWMKLEAAEHDLNCSLSGYFLLGLEPRK
jgi:hypothetical protein